MKKRMLSLLLALVLLVGLLPTAALAEGAGDPKTQVHVIVENTTFTEVVDGKTPAWTDELVEDWVTLTETSTMMSCIKAAIEENGYTQVGAESGYISKIHNLAEKDGGDESGWMILQNDWFINESASEFTVAKGNLTAGDEIRVCYSSSGLGADLGGTAANNNKTLKALNVSVGTLSPVFASSTTAYTLTVPAGTTSVKVTPTASNKNFQVRTTVNGTEYKRPTEVAIADGTVITVKCGDPEWPSMNNQAGNTDNADPVTYTITVSVEDATTPTTPTPWDGEAKTEPQKDTDGVYQISNGAELAWFVATSETTANKVTISGKLTADIDLNNKSWVASTTSGKGQIIKLDGAGHKVTGLNSNLGLLGVVSGAGSEVKDLTVCGEVDGSSNGSSIQKSAGIVASFGNGTMENCINYVNVKGVKNVGGLIGYSGNKNVKILNCANYGSVTATTGEFAGGLVGQMGVGCTVTSCYNVGTITGVKNVGGLVGGMYDGNSGSATVTGCYNIGNVSGTQNVGGLFGFAKAANEKNPTQVNDCYSTGTVTGTVTGTSTTNPLFGKAATTPAGNLVTTSGCVYLDTTGTDSYGTAKTDAELKALDGLSSTYFKSSCGGYPAVIWQTAENHSPKDAGDVTAPTCEAGGYTTYTCSACGTTYQSDFTAALGHKYCEHGVDTTCDHCTQDPAPGETTYGTLKRHCQNGCGTDKEEEIKPTIRYTITLPTDTTGYTVTAASGSTSPVATDESFSFTVTIATGYKKGDSFAVKANDTTLTENNGVYTIENIKADQTVTVEGVEAKTIADDNLTVIAPAGSTIIAGQFHTYYKYELAEVLKTETLADGRISVVFALPKNQSFYRVQNPDGVTYWEFAEKSGVFSKGDKFEVTADMLHIGDTDFTKDTVYSNFEKNGYDKADLYLNINEKGYLAMEQGDTYELNVFRNWIALDNSTMNTGVALPDVTYTVISEDGTSSSVVTVTPDTNNSCVATLTANSTGTAIVLVTYDAMTNKTALGGSQFSAIWPENTGVFVVTVGADGSSIQTNMTVNEGLNTAYNKTALDAEHDILFYVDDAGASYSFTPESGCTVSVARSTVTTKMSFNGFTTTGITTDAEGKVTITGLTTGAHIVKVEKDGKAAYQVIRARKVSYTLTDEEGNTVNAQNPVYPGDTVTVQFTGLISPMEKLSGIYNSNFGFYYNGEDDVEIRTVGGYYGVYDFSGNSNRQKFTVTIPEDWGKTSYTLTDGAITAGGFGSFAGAHRGVTYAEGKPVNTTADQINGVLSVLPDIVIPTTYDCTITLPTGDGYKVTGETSVQCGNNYTFTVAVLGGYDGSSMVVKVNGEPVTAQQDGSYKVSAVSTDLVITVEGVVELSQTFTGEGTKIYTYGFEDEEDETNGNGWIADLSYIVNVKDLSLLGAAVKSASWNEDWSICTVVLSSDTAQNAIVGFDLTFDVSKFTQSAEQKAEYLGFMSATLNGSPMTAGQPTAVKLVDGKATVAIQVTEDEGEEEYILRVTKTIVLSIAEPDFYDVTLPTGKGYTVTGEDTAATGGDYTFTVEVQKGYDGGKMVVKVNGTPVTAGEDGSYKVENVHEALTITVEGVEKQPAIPTQPVISSKPAVKDEETVSFTDVKKSDWYYESVKFVCENGLMNGTGNGQFSPNANTTRGMIVTILARLEGVNTESGANWYEAGQQWAMKNGISDGTNMTGEMTREQLATMLYRYARLKGYATTASADLSSFKDANSVSDWAKEAMQWAVGVGLIQGSDNQLTPNAPATRAQVATILMRFIENLAK